MGDDKCMNDANCIAATKEFLILQNRAEELASTSRRYCKDSRGLTISAAVAAGVAVLAAYASVSICAQSGQWFNILCIGTMGIAVVGATASAAAGGAALAALATYRSTLTIAKAAKVAMSEAYEKMIETCGGECADKMDFDLHC